MGYKEQGGDSMAKTIYRHTTVSLNFKKRKDFTEGLRLHDEREPGKKVNHKNENIDKSRTHLNKTLYRAEGRTWHERVKNIIAREYKGTKAVRKDAVKLITTTVQLGGDLGAGKGDEADKVKSLETAYEILKEQVGEQNIVAAHIHVDEGNPHLHFAFVPIFGGKLSAKEFMGTRGRLVKQQNNFLKELQRREPRMKFDRKTDQTLNGLEQDVFERMTRLSKEHERELDEREDELDLREEQLENRECELTRREREVDERSKLNQKRVFELDEREKSIKILERDLSSREGSILAREGQISKREQNQKTLDDKLKQKHDELTSKVGEANTRLKAKMEIVAQAERDALAERARLDDEIKKVEERDKLLDTREQVLQDKESALKRREDRLKAAIDTQNSAIKRDKSEISRLLGKVRRGEEIQRQERDKLQDYENWYGIEEDYDDEMTL